MPEPNTNEITMTSDEVVLETRVLPLAARPPPPHLGSVHDRTFQSFRVASKATHHTQGGCHLVKQRLRDPRIRKKSMTKEKSLDSHDHSGTIPSKVWVGVIWSDSCSAS